MADTGLVPENAPVTRPLFASRMGILTSIRLDEPWRSRHTTGGWLDIADKEIRCVCPGPNDCLCVMPMTQEDFMCNSCRAYCFAVIETFGGDVVGTKFVRLVDLNGV